MANARSRGINSMVRHFQQRTGLMCEFCVMFSLVSSKVHYFSWALGYFVDSILFHCCYCCTSSSHCRPSSNLSVCLSMHTFHLLIHRNYIILKLHPIKTRGKKRDRQPGKKKKQSHEVCSTQVKKMYKNTLNLFITKLRFCFCSRLHTFYILFQCFTMLFSINNDTKRKSCDSAFGFFFNFYAHIFFFSPFYSAPLSFWNLLLSNTKPACTCDNTMKQSILNQMYASSVFIQSGWIYFAKQQIVLFFFTHLWTY